MKIVELVLDDNEESGIEAISIVESPAIESDFVALKSDEVKLAEVDTEKKILMGALLIPNKPIYRKTEGEEYYIYFSKDTVLKASQRYLTNGYQGNSTLEHSDNLQGLTLVESWIVEDDKFDKSRKYDMNVPIGTWMGTVKVNNEEVWNDYVKTGKVKGFSIEGFFADKIKASEMKKEEQEADLLLSKITSIVKGERIDLNIVNTINKIISSVDNEKKKLDNAVDKYYSKILDLPNEFSSINESLLFKEISKLKNEVKSTKEKAKEFGLTEKSLPILNDATMTISSAEEMLEEYQSALKVNKKLSNLL